MIGDIWTVLWKDLRGYRAQFEDRRRAILGIAASVFFLVLIELVVGIHDQIGNAHPVLLIWIWCWLPLGSAVTLSTDAIAGERERHTLESLLATRIPTQALLIGKSLSITIQSWISAFMLAFGAMAALNAALIWRGDFFFIPWSVLLIGPLLSFLLTLLGTLVALLFSMDAPTVRQANFRIVIITSILPVLMIVPLLFLLFFAVIGLAFVLQFTSFEVDRELLALNTTTVAFVIFLACVGLFVAIGLTYLITALRFTRERLLRVASPDTRESSADQREVRSHALTPHFGFSRTSEETALAERNTRWSPVSAATRPKWFSVLQDASVVAWKELVEARGLIREWRGWIFVIGFVLLSMIVQVSIIASWYWAQDADTSLLFWIAMAGALPLLIAQRSADAIAGERERHTGEILFTTRLSHTGIILGKLGATALLPWLLLLTIPAIGLISTNLIHSTEGPFLYPSEVLVAGSGLTLGVALLFSSAGMLVSLGAPTVQHAARRISWFLMPVLIAPGLVFRSSLWSSDMTRNGDLDSSGALGLLASGDLALYVLAALPIVALTCAGMIYILFSRFKRGKTVFD